MKRLAWLLPAILLYAGLLTSWGRAQDSGSGTLGESGQLSTVSYFKDVRPIFQTHCQGCHQPAKPKGEFVITKYESLLTAGESEMPAITPGDPDESYLLEMIIPVDGEAEMPRGKKPLSGSEISSIKTWIAEGAKDDTPPDSAPPIDMDHPPVYEAPPVITSLEYSPDGKSLVVSGYHEVFIYDTTSWSIAARLVGLSERIESARFSPDGTKIAIAGGSPGRSGEIQIWSVANKELLLSLPVGFDTVYGAAWSGDGKLVSFGCADNTLRAIEADSGKQVVFQGAHNDWVLDTAFSTDSSHLVSVSRDMSLKLVDVPTDRFVDNITSITPGALKGGLMTVDRHPKKDELLVGGSDGTPKIFRMYRDPSKPRKIGDDFNLIRNFEPMPGRIYSARYNQDGTQIVVGSSLDGHGEVRVYNVESGAIVSRFSTETGGIYAVSYSPDGNRVAVGGFDGIVRVIDPKTGKVVQEFVSAPLKKKGSLKQETVGSAG